MILGRRKKHHILRLGNALGNKRGLLHPFPASNACPTLLARTGSTTSPNLQRFHDVTEKPGFGERPVKKTTGFFVLQLP